MTDAGGHGVGSGVVAVAITTASSVAVSGSNQYSVDGTGSLSFYGPAETSLGVSGNWNSYTATVTGNVSITLTSDGLTLNGQTLPAGTYTITTTSATLSGSGLTTSPNFSGLVSINVTGGTVNLGPSSGTFMVGGNSLASANGGTLDGYTGSITVAAGGGNITDAVTLGADTTNVLTVSVTPSTFSTNQNNPVTFQAKVNTSLADTYTLTAHAPPGWTVVIDSSGNVTVTPTPGVQGGAYPIQVVAQSSSDPNLVAHDLPSTSRSRPRNLGSISVSPRILNSPCPSTARKSRPPSTPPSKTSAPPPTPTN